MAENIVSSLFGITPQMYGEQQRVGALNEGIQLAQLDPAARGAALTYGGAKGLGTAIGGAMGVQDPQLQMISARQSIAKQIDQTDPESILKGAQMLAQAGDQQGAMALSDFARKAQVQIAEQQQRLAAGRASDAAAKREQQPKTPEKIQIAEYLSKLNLTLDDLVASPQSPERDAEINKVSRTIKALELQFEKPDRLISSGADRDAYSRQMFDNKVYVDLTPAQQEAVNKRLEDLGVKRAREGAAQTNVNAYTPASVEAQKQFIQDVAKERSVLRTAPDTIKNIEAAKKLIPSASTFMGKGGEPLLAAASFLNNRLGFGISTQGVTDATVLRTRLFEGILDNLKKLDSQPSQEQQRVLSEALGNLGTDPAALEQILNRIGDTVTDRVDRYNTDVTESEARGIKFPFKPQITLPQRPRAPGSAASQIPTQSSVPTASQKPIYATNPTTKERIMSIDGGINWTSAR